MQVYNQQFTSFYRLIPEGFVRLTHFTPGKKNNKQKKKQPGTSGILSSVGKGTISVHPRRQMTQWLFVSCRYDWQGWKCSHPRGRADFSLFFFHRLVKALGTFSIHLSSSNTPNIFQREVRDTKETSVNSVAGFHDALFSRAFVSKLNSSSCNGKEINHLFLAGCLKKTHHK